MLLHFIENVCAGGWKKKNNPAYVSYDKNVNKIFSSVYQFYIVETLCDSKQVVEQ